MYIMVVNKACLRPLGKLARQYCRDERLSTFSYWKSQYQRKTQDIGFDWFLDSKAVLSTILDNMQEVTKGPSYTNCVDEEAKRSFVSYLDLGCGTSSLSLQVLKTWPHSVLQVLLDFIPEALTYQMTNFAKSECTGEKTTFVGVCADVQSLPFASNAFNIIIDKGTMDALLKDRSQGHHKTKLMLSEVVRVLAPGGRYLQISDEDPDSRLLYLEQICSLFHEHSPPQEVTRTLPSSQRHLENSNKGTLDLILPQGRLLNHSDLMKSHLKILCSPDKVSVSRENANQEDEMKENNQNCLSSWSFKVLSSPGNIEYFVYWADKNL